MKEHCTASFIVIVHRQKEFELLSESALPPDASEINALGEALEPCSVRPLTGYTRQGRCETGPQDLGSHTVCAQVTAEFLEFSRARGNDLITPIPEYDFPGLKPGDRWCLCAARWLEALKADVAPPVLLKATHAKALEVVTLSMLKPYAHDLN